MVERNLMTVPAPEYLVIFETTDGSPCDLGKESREGLAKHFRAELGHQLIQPAVFSVGGKNVVRIERLNPLTPSDMVKEFHNKYGHPVHSVPTTVETSRDELRVSLIKEEVEELVEAVALPQDTEEERCVRLVAIADALSDLNYVTYGGAHEWGIPLDACTAEVHRSNLTKLGDDGRPIYNTLGKVEKGPAYEEPNLRTVLFPNEVAQ